MPSLASWLLLSGARSMNELTDSLPDGPPNGPVSGNPVSAGGMLRRAREAAGLHIGALAVSLKVPVKKLEALEADRLDLLPDAVFARALAGTVCRILKIDPAPVLAALPPTNAQRETAERIAHPPSFRPSGHASQKSLAERLSRPLVLLGFAFAIGALVLMFFPAIQQLVDDVKKGAESAGTPAAPQPPVQSAVNATAGIANAPTEVAASNIQTSSLASPVAAITAMAGATPAPAPAVVSTEPTEVLMLTARGSSWVEVTDANRLVVLRKTMISGESQNLGGSLPMTVILGRANLLDVQVRGKALDLVALTKDNVARFEVK